MEPDIDVVLARYEPVAVTGVQAEKVVALREAMRYAAEVLCEKLPHGREKALALTALEEAAMWAVKAVTHG